MATLFNSTTISISIFSFFITRNPVLDVSRPTIHNLTTACMHPRYRYCTLIPLPRSVNSATNRNKLPCGLYTLPLCVPRSPTLLNTLWCHFIASLSVNLYKLLEAVSLFSEHPATYFPVKSPTSEFYKHLFTISFPFSGKTALWFNSLFRVTLLTWIYRNKGCAGSQI